MGKRRRTFILSVACGLYSANLRYLFITNSVYLSFMASDKKEILLKSGMQRPFKRALKRDWQLNLYAYALRYGEVLENGSWLRIRMKVDKTSIYFLRAYEIYKRDGKYGKKGSQKGRPWISCEKPSWELFQFKQELLDIIKMRTRDWAFPNTASCGFCAFHDQCDDRIGMHLLHAYRKVSHLIPAQENLGT